MAPCQLPTSVLQCPASSRSRSSRLPSEDFCKWFYFTPFSRVVVSVTSSPRDDFVKNSLFQAPSFAGVPTVIRTSRGCRRSGAGRVILAANRTRDALVVGHRSYSLVVLLSSVTAAKNISPILEHNLVCVLQALYFLCMYWSTFWAR